jgi:hypothetical protein
MVEILSAIYFKLFNNTSKIIEYSIELMDTMISFCLEFKADNIVVHVNIKFMRCTFVGSMYLFSTNGE